MPRVRLTPMPVSIPATPTQCADRQVWSIAETERLRLRQVTDSDLPTLVQLLGNLDVMRYSVTGPLARPQIVEVLGKILKSYDDSPLALWGVAEKRSRRVIGLCGFLPRQLGGISDWELAYRFLPESWGRGLATEAAIACREFAFQQPDVPHIIGLIEPANVASIRVAEKAGLAFREVLQLENLLVHKYVLDRSNSPSPSY